MNERIKELALRAGFEEHLFAGGGMPLDILKFYELIIDEVLQVIAVSDSKCLNEFDYADRDLYVEIQKHFGVE